MIRRGGCLAWGLGIVAALVVAGVGGAAIVFGYYGPPLEPIDGKAEMDALGAESWGVDQGGDWSGVREVLAVLDAVETEVGAPPREEDGFVRRDLSFVIEDADERAPAALDLLVDRGVVEMLAALPAEKPLHDGWDDEGVTSLLDAMLGDLGGVRQLMRAMHRRFVEAARVGDDDAAMAAFDALLSLNEVMARQPVVISRLVGIGGEALALDGATALAVRGEGSVALLRDLQERLEGRTLGTLEYVFRGEALASKTSLMKELPGGPLVFMSPAAQYQPIETFYEDVIAALALPPSEAVVAMSEAFDRALSKPYWKYPMVHVLLPAINMFAISQFSVEVERNGAVQALALERYRRAEGRFPPTLEALIGDELDALPEDAFGGGPFVYRVGEDPTVPSIDGGCVLYAVGLDGEDNGGALPSPDAVGVDREPFRSQGRGLDYMIMGPDAASVGGGG